MGSDQRRLAGPTLPGTPRESVSGRARSIEPERMHIVSIPIFEIFRYLTSNHQGVPAIKSEFQGFVGPILFELGQPSHLGYAGSLLCFV
jgi:hypothetical protein